MTNIPSLAYLHQRSIPYERKSFPLESEKDAANVVRVLGVSERQAVKTLIFEAGTGEKVLVMLGEDQSAISGNLKKATGSRDIKMAAPDVVKQITGYAIGSIPAFGWQPPGFRSFLGASLLEEPILAPARASGAKEL